MESLSTSSLADVAESRIGKRSRAMCGFLLLAGGVMTSAPCPVFATSAPDVQRFQIVATGALTLDEPVQKGGNVQLKAYLTPSGAMTAVVSPAGEGARFALTASLTTASLVCYNDTIFRDGFDGTGF